MSVEELVWAGLALALSYLVGSMPFAYVVARRLRGFDIRKVGSRNVGALNVFREVGAGAGTLVLLADIGKGAIVVALPGWLGAPDWAVYYTPVAAVAGHNWPVSLRFRGGKGLAPVIGISLAMLPLLTLVAALPAVAVIAASRNVVVGGAVGFLSLNALTVITTQSSATVVLCLVLSILVTVTHLAGTWRQYLEAVRERRWASVLWVE